MIFLWKFISNLLFTSDFCQYSLLILISFLVNCEMMCRMNPVIFMALTSLRIILRCKWLQRWCQPEKECIIILHSVTAVLLYQTETKHSYLFLGLVLLNSFRFTGVL